MNNPEALKKLLVDRQKQLKFIESSHKYFVGETELTSVTTFIGGYFPKFDPKGASFGTAKVVNKEFAALLDHKQPSQESMPKAFRLFGEEAFLDECRSRWKKITKGYAAVSADEVKEFWKLKGKKASEHGTEVHEGVEYYILGDSQPKLKYPEWSKPKIDQGIRYLINLEDVAEFLPEVRIYSEDMRLAGTIDLLVIHTDGTISLHDWKSNEEISTSGYNGKKALEPIKDLQDCSYDKYGLQLSIYQEILEREYNTQVKGRYLVHLLPDDYVKFDMAPMRDHVIKMEEHFKKVDR